MFSWFKKKQKELEVKERPDLNIGQSEIVYEDTTTVPLGPFIRNEILLYKGEDWEGVSEPIISFVNTVKMHPERFSYEIKSVPFTNECLIKIIDKYNERSYSLYVKGWSSETVHLFERYNNSQYLKGLSYEVVEGSIQFLDMWTTRNGLRISTDINISLTKKESMYLLSNLFLPQIRRGMIERKKAVLDLVKEQWKIRKELTKLYKGEIDNE